MPYLTEAMLVTLGKAGIKTLDDLADLATDELVRRSARNRAAATRTPPSAPRTRAAFSPNMA
jgi:N utilization substance protein A